MSSLTLPRQRTIPSDATPAVSAIVPRRRRSRAKPRPARARTVVMSELRGLGGLVLELALLDRSAQPKGSLLEWTDRLAAELGVQDGGRPETHGDLLDAIVRIQRRALADPDRPTVALPPAA